MIFRLRCAVWKWNFSSSTTIDCEVVKKFYTKHQKEEIHTKKAHNRNVHAPREIFLRFSFAMKQ